MVNLALISIPVIVVILMAVILWIGCMLILAWPHRPKSPAASTAPRTSGYVYLVRGDSESYQFQHSPLPVVEPSVHIIRCGDRLALHQQLERWFSPKIDGAGYQLSPDDLEFIKRIKSA